MSGVGEQPVERISMRVLAILRENGPMATDRILFTLRHAFSEAGIRMALHHLEDKGEIERPSQKQRWGVRV